MSTSDRLIGLFLTTISLPRLIWCKLRGVRVGLFSGARLVTLPKIRHARTISFGKHVTIGRFVRAGKVGLLSATVFLSTNLVPSARVQALQFRLARGQVSALAVF